MLGRQVRGGASQQHEPRGEGAGPRAWGCRGAGGRRGRGGAPQDPKLAPRTAAQSRTAYLDALKVFLTVSVVTFHVTCCFACDSCIKFNMYFCKSIDGPFTREGCLRHAFIDLVGRPFIQLNNAYFMYLFFFISGFFTPGSLDKKGLREFLRDRVKRLGLPAVAWYVALGPLLAFLSARVVMGVPLQYGQHGMWLIPGPPWFVVVLFFFCGVYGFVQTADGGTPCKIAFPRVSTFLSVGVLLGLVNISLGDAPFFVFMGGAKQFVNSAVFFWGGIAARRNGWAQHLEQLPVRALRFLRALTLLLGFLIWLLVAVAFRNDVSDTQVGVVQGVFSVAVSLTLLDSFRRVFTGASSIVRFMSDAAYTVYLIHPWVLALAVWAYAHALHAYGFAIGRTCSLIHPGMQEAGQAEVPLAYLVEADGEGLLWLGWAFALSVTMLVVWPLAYGIAKLPGLRQIL